MALDGRGIIEPEDAADRAKFVSAAIDGYLSTRTGSPEVMRNIDAASYVGAELSQANRRTLSGQERIAVADAAADKLRKRFGGN